MVDADAGELAGRHLLGRVVTADAAAGARNAIEECRRGAKNRVVAPTAAKSGGEIEGRGPKRRRRGRVRADVICRLSCRGTAAVCATAAQRFSLHRCKVLLGTAPRLQITRQKGLIRAEVVENSLKLQLQHRIPNLGPIRVIVDELLCPFDIVTRNVTCEARNDGDGAGLLPDRQGADGDEDHRCEQNNSDGDEHNRDGVGHKGANGDGLGDRVRRDDAEAAAAEGFL